MFRQQRESQQIRKVGSCNDTGLLLGLHPIRNMHILFIVLVSNDDHFTITGIPPNGFHASLHNQRCIIQSLPPAHPDFIFQGRITYRHRGVEIVFPIEVAVALLKILHQDLMLVYQALANRRRFLETVTIHDLNIHLGPEGLQGLRPRCEAGDFCSRSAFLTNAMKIASNAIVSFHFIPCFFAIPRH